MQTTEPASHIPPGFRTVTPYFIVDEPERLVAFAKTVFGAEELQDQRALGPDGKLLHTAFRIGDSVLETGRASDPWKPLKIGIHLFVHDVDAAYALALKAGGKSLHEVKDMDYGERSGAVQDPFGNQWYIATYMKSQGRGPA
ncbi:MAG: hypothetical protein AUG17_03345 [Crenarchaeota archaeon 13_1_20CM_2_53_14]|nr:MAG: hypothetical protein AUI07_05455 [archaeon 13_2_20CM_2_53_6]OLE59293.1 MAG: hypothetical protein AUG17_03345 [Crenarchaeota archaeon 13_1_20CM_2_53_14]